MSRKWATKLQIMSSSSGRNSVVCSLAPPAATTILVPLLNVTRPAWLRSLPTDNMGPSVQLQSSFHWRCRCSYNCIDRLIALLCCSLWKSWYDGMSTNVMKLLLLLLKSSVELSSLMRGLMIHLNLHCNILYAVGKNSKTVALGIVRYYEISRVGAVAVWCFTNTSQCNIQ